MRAVWLWIQGPLGRSLCALRLFRVGTLSRWWLQVWRDEHSEVQEHLEVSCWLGVWTQMNQEHVPSRKDGPSLPLAPPTSTQTPLKQSWLKKVQQLNSNKDKRKNSRAASSSSSFL